MTVDNKRFNNIRDNHPEIFQWMRDKAQYEGCTVGAVLNNYSDYIDLEINKEVMNKVANIITSSKTTI